MVTTTTPRKLLNGEPLVRLADVAREFPGARGAAAIHPATLTRWIKNGVKCRGRRVRLESVRMGSILYTTWAAVERFQAKLAVPDPVAEAQAGEAVPRDDGGDAAGKALERMGA